MKKKNFYKFIIIFTLIFYPLSNVYGIVKTFKYGKGPLLLSEDMANVLEFFFSGGRMGIYAEEQSTAWFPGIIVVAEDGSNFSFMRRPAHVDASNVDTKNYVGMTLKDCRKKSGKECYLFASGYKILWDNGSNKKRRKLKRKEIRAGKTKAILQELGFYNPDYSQSSGSSSSDNSSSKSKEKPKKNNQNIVKDLKELNDLYKSGVISLEEFEKAKKKLLN